MTYQHRPWLLASCLTLPLILAGCEGDDGRDGRDGLDGSPGTPGEDATASRIGLTFLGRYETGEFDESAAEIVDYDPATRQAFVVNANSGRVDILDISAPSTPTLARSLDVAADIAGAVVELDGPDSLGAANSVAVSGNTLAVAVEADVKQDNGWVAFYQTDGTFLSAVEAGALPDMLTFTPDGNTVLVANEGEPNGDYSVDPEGSITLIDVSAGAGSVSAANVKQLRFNDFNTGGSKALDEDVRISAKSASIAQDLEPEYIAVSSDSRTAWVALQENNAVARVDIDAGIISEVTGLGYKDHSLPGNELDASNRDGGINLRQWPLRGVYMPDSMTSYEVSGITYLVTANEGDGREYLTDAESREDCSAQGGFDYDDGDCFHYLDEIRVGDILDSGATIELANLQRFAPDLETLTDNANLGRIKVIANLGVRDCPAGSLETTGQPTEGCVYEALYSYGARSFSIWNGSTGERVFDSGNDFETLTAERLGEDFNASNDENGGDDRSDDKGPEPEAIEVATIDGKIYAFIGLERVGGIMVYDVSNPERAEFVQYLNTRDFSVDIEALVDAGDFSAAGDLGPESIRFVAAEDSPSGEDLLIVGNEVSGTTALFAVDVIAEN
ncbi:choice-of-anchor I family protein [Haliea atlantica]|nr:MerR family transcriptional regulator [Haliea sp.]